MIFADLLGALFVSLLIAVIFSAVFKVRGPWESFFAFLVIIFLFTWLFNVWIPPFGPLVWGYPIFTGLFMGLLIAFLLAAAAPPRKVREPLEMEKDTEAKAAAAGIALGVFFWFFIFFALIAILTAYFV